MATTLLPHYETGDVRIEKIVVGPFENNVFVLRSKGTGDAVIIDAANEHELLLDVSKRTGVRRVLSTSDLAETGGRRVASASRSLALRTARRLVAPRTGARGTKTQPT